MVDVNFNELIKFSIKWTGPDCSVNHNSTYLFVCDRHIQVNLIESLINSTASSYSYDYYTKLN